MAAAVRSCFHLVTLSLFCCWYLFTEARSYRATTAASTGTIGADEEHSTLDHSHTNVDSTTETALISRTVSSGGPGTESTPMNIAGMSETPAITSEGPVTESTPTNMNGTPETSTTTSNSTLVYDETTTPPGTCSSPAVPADLDVTSPLESFYDVNSTINWQCTDHQLCYVIDGNDTMTCQETGNWSASIPTCRYSPNAYGCPNPLLSATVKNATHYVSGPVNSSLAPDDDEVSCGLTLVLQCLPAHEVTQGRTRTSLTCQNQVGWTDSLSYFACQAKFHFISCIRFFPSRLVNYTTFFLVPNGEFQCRSRCLLTGSYPFSILLGTDQCMCTDSRTFVLETASVESSDACDISCAGQDEEYCGGSIPAKAMSETEVTGAAYFTIGGCYQGLQALTGNNVTLAENKLTPVLCRQFCLLNDARYAVLSGVNCTCLDHSHVTVLHEQALVPSSTDCTLACLEDQSQRCGGENAVSVYNLDPSLVYSTVETCYDLFLEGIRDHGLYELKDGVHYCYMADNTSCPDGWLGFRDSCYLFVTDNEGLSGAVGTCNAKGGHLLSIHASVELNFVKDTLSTFTPYNSTELRTLGLYDPDRSGRFVWADGLPFKAVGFPFKNPGLLEGKRCATIVRGPNLDWNWVDRYCTELNQAFVCEKPADSRLTEVGTCARGDIINDVGSFPITPMTVGVCRQLCAARLNGSFALVNAQRCACALDTELTNGSVQAMPGQCGQYCPGHGLQMCGQDNDTLVFNVYPPLRPEELAWSCRDLYFSGVNHSSTYMLKRPEEHPYTEYCNFTQHEIMCPPSWFYINGSCLRPHIGAASSVREAMECCDTQGGFLTTRVPPDSNWDIGGLENDVALFYTRFGRYVMGLMAPLQSAVFRMVDGSLLPGVHFKTGEPQTATDLCVGAYLESGQWAAVNCVLGLRYVCQKDVAFSDSVIAANTSNTPQVVSKLTCLSSSSLLPTLTDTETLTFTWEDMTLTSCLERCRGVRGQWAVVTFDTCRCYDDEEVTWGVFRGAEHRVQCGQRCPGHTFQYCGGDGHAAVMIVGMYPTLAQNCSQLYMEGVRMEATYLIQEDPGNPPVETNCTFVDGDRDSSVSSGWIHFQNNLYYFHLGATTVEEARAFCWEQEGAYLLSVVNQAEDDFLNFTLGGLASYRYRQWLVGYTEYGQNGVRGWMSPDLFLYTPGDNFTCEGYSTCCVSLNVTWDQLQVVYAPCDQPEGFICKRPSAEQGCYSFTAPSSSPLTPSLVHDPDMSALLCKQACRGNGPSVEGYIIAGTSCYCLMDDSLEDFLLQQQEERLQGYTPCGSPCVGHPSLFCGDEEGGHALVYRDSIVYDSEKAMRCTDIVDNGLYVNTTYRLGRNHSSDVFLNCYKECSALAVASPANLNSEEWIYRSNVSVTCPPGARFPSGAQEAFAFCTASGWQNTEQQFTCLNTTCPDLSPGDASVDSWDTAYNSLVTVTCHNGFLAPGSVAFYTVLCTDSGHWSLPPADCQRKSCAFPASLSGLQDLPPSEVTFEFDTALTLLCREGWTTDLGASVQVVRCNSSSLWEPELLSCTEQVVCQGEEFLNPNTTWIYRPGFNTTTTTAKAYGNNVGSQASSTSSTDVTLSSPSPHGTLVGEGLELGCHNDHEFLDGSASMDVLCTADGVFNPPLQNCTAPCDTSVFTYSQVVVERIGDSTVADVTCYHGYQFRSGDFHGQTTCVDGSWVNVTEYMCQQPLCSPLSLTNAADNVTTISGVTVANVTCLNLNTFADGSTRKTYVCVQGVWTPPVEDCVVRCPELTVTSATVTRTIDPQNSQEQAVVRCFTGHHFPDDTVEKTLSCLAPSGAWSEPFVPGCVLTTCDESKLSGLCDATVSTIQTVGDAILKRVTCEDGYQLPDQTTSRVYGCDGGGKWYPSLDNCTAIDCATLLGQTNAAMSSESRVYQAEVTLTCASGWAFVDGTVSKVHACQANKTWSPSPEYCLRKLGTLSA